LKSPPFSLRLTRVRTPGAGGGCERRERISADPGLGDKTEVYRLRRFISPGVRGLGGVTVTAYEAGLEVNGILSELA
ncbi:hypothetical protein HMPREF0201_00972, partial [Cedecea davisae DSM 4568]